MTRLAHLPKASVRVPPGWYLWSLFSLLEEVASFLCLKTELHCESIACSVVGFHAVLVSWAKNILASIVCSSVAMAVISSEYVLSVLTFLETTRKKPWGWLRVTKSPYASFSVGLKIASGCWEGGVWGSKWVSGGVWCRFWGRSDSWDNCGSKGGSRTGRCGWRNFHSVGCGGGGLLVARVYFVVLRWLGCWGRFRLGACDAFCGHIMTSHHRCAAIGCCRASDKSIVEGAWIRFRPQYSVVLSY